MVPDAQRPLQRLRLSFVWSPGPRLCQEWLLDLPTGSTLLGALQRLAQGDVPANTPNAPTDWRAWVQACEQGDVGIWGRLAAPDTLLRDGDRIERYCPLRVDPKVARRERYRQQLAKQQEQRKR